jgi:hypothetical protein
MKHCVWLTWLPILVSFYATCVRGCTKMGLRDARGSELEGTGSGWRPMSDPLFSLQQGISCWPKRRLKDARPLQCRHSHYYTWMERPNIKLNWVHQRTVIQATLICVFATSQLLSLQEFVCSNIYKSNRTPCQKFKLIEYRNSLHSITDKSSASISCSVELLEDFLR